MSDPRGRRGRWRIEFGSGGTQPPRGPRRPTAGDDAGRPRRPGFGRRSRLLVLAVLLVLLALTLLFLRPLLHGPLMLVWRAPLPWIVALGILAAGGIVGRRARLTVADLQAGRDPRSGVWAATLTLAGVSFCALQALNPVLVQRSLAAHTDYTAIDEFPHSGVVRLVPREVAGRVMVAGFNSSTERLTDLAVINTPDGLKWSAIRTPQGALRRYTEKSGGLELQSAEDPTRNVEQLDASFKYAPGLAVFDALNWKLRERRLLADVQAPVGILDSDGEPLVLVPYLTYTGFPIRRPQLGGAFVVHPSGQIEDLSPSEAARRPEIATSGRLFPDTLARRIQDAHALKGGIWNYLLLHKDQTQIVDTESNRQPYLLQGPGNSTSWVSVAQPHGASSATTAIFLTDSTTGATKLWKVAPRDALTGNARAIDIAEATPIAGIGFGTGGAANPTSGSYRAVEPRPVFVQGKLYFIVSVVPSTATTVTKTIVVDAQRNATAAVFDTTEEGLRDTLSFLENGLAGDAQDESDDATDQPQATAGQPDETPAATTPQSRAELQRQVTRALERQQQALEELKTLQQQLGTTP
ncbi:MAG: hypothetical protein QM679_12165 [Patulibacter sp.]